MSFPEGVGPLLRLRHRMCGRREPGPPLDCIDIWSKAVELVNMGLQQTMGSLFHRHLVAARTDIPQPTDVNAPPPIAKTNMCSLASRKVVAMAAEVNSPSASWKSTTSSPSLRGEQTMGKTCSCSVATATGSRGTVPRNTCWPACSTWAWWQGLTEGKTAPPCPPPHQRRSRHRTGPGLFPGISALHHCLGPEGQ